MCGRIACTLEADIICRALTYQEPDGTYKKPSWREHPPSEDDPDAYVYYPSANMAPTSFTPVMIVKKEQAQKKKKRRNAKKGKNDQEIDREIMPMLWSLIPFYHKGPPKKHGLSTNNCRLEGVSESTVYKNCWEERKFCVVLCQGFYKWEETDTVVGTGRARKGSKRQPYLFYSPQQNAYGTTASSFVADKVNWENADWSEEDGWDGPEMLKMAGLYDVWTCPETGDEVYSYTIITMDSDQSLEWISNRMPAVLDTEEKVEKWLGAAKNPKKMTDREIRALLQPVDCLQWHMVDGKVGNSRCHDEDCLKEYTVPLQQSQTASQKKTSAAKGKRDQDQDDGAQASSSGVKRVKKK